MRLLPPLLSLLLIFSGCYTTRTATPTDLPQQIRAGDAPLFVTTVDGETVRVDPNTDLRFVLRGGMVTDWVRGAELWRSELGLSYEQDGGTCFVTWDELEGIELRNLSGGKTFGAILLFTVIVGVAVVLIAASLKGGGGLGGSSPGGGKSSKKARAPRRRSVRRRLPRARGGVHVHVPLALLVGVSQEPPPTYRDAPPPPPPGGEVVEIHTPPPAHAAPARVEAVRLFQGGIRRRSSIELVGMAAAGTELVRFEGYSGSMALGMRIRESFEILGGFRHTLAPLPADRGSDVESGFIGFGRIGAHLWIDDRHRFALPIAVDAGAGHRVRVHLRLAVGLRFHPIRNLSVGLLPFNPSFSYYEEDSAFDGAMRWTFPTTVEVGFSF